MCVSPIARPSWPRIYSTTPRPSSPMALHRTMELLAAVAPQGREHVSRQALRMHPGEDVLPVTDVAEHQRDVRATVDRAFVRVRAELAVRRRDRRLRHLGHERLVLAAIGDEVGDRDDLQSVLGAEADQVRQPRHRSVLVHGLAENAGRVEPGEPGEIDGGLGVTGALEHPAFAVPQRKDVSGSGEVLWRGARLHDRPDRGRPIRRRDPRADPATGVHRHGECRVALIGVVGDHQRDLELVESIPHDRHADHAARMPNDERDRLGRHLLRRHDQIALVLSIRVVDDDHDPACTDVLNRLRDRRER